MRPFTAFNFVVEITLDGQSQPLCSAAFSECSGLEMTMTPKTFQEGGNNAEQIHLVGPLGYGQLMLKRGMTKSFDLWTWFEAVQNGSYALRGTGVVVMLDSTGGDENARFVLTRCLPVRIKAPALNASNGEIAIEELEIAYERMRLESAGGAGFGVGIGLGVSAGVSIGASAGVSVGASASVGASVSAGASLDVGF